MGMNTCSWERRRRWKKFVARVVSDLVPVTFPVKAVFPYKQKSPNALVASLELWWGSNEIFGMPKGGLDTPCSLAFARVHSVLEIALFCSLRVVIYRCCSSALLYGLLYKQMLYSSV